MGEHAVMLTSEGEVCTERAPVGDRGLPAEEEKAQWCLCGQMNTLWRPPGFVPGSFGKAEPPQALPLLQRWFSHSRRVELSESIGEETKSSRKLAEDVHIAWSVTPTEITIPLSLPHVHVCPVTLIVCDYSKSPSLHMFYLLPINFRVEVVNFAVSSCPFDKGM